MKSFLALVLLSLILVILWSNHLRQQAEVDLLDAKVESLKKENELMERYLKHLDEVSELLKHLPEPKGK